MMEVPLVLGIIATDLDQSWLFHFPVHTALSMPNHVLLGFTYSSLHSIDRERRNHGSELRPVSIGYVLSRCSDPPTRAINSASEVARRQGLLPASIARNSITK